MSREIRGTAPARQVSRFDREFDPASLATADEVQRALAEIDLELLSIKGSLEASVARYHATGVRGHPDWFRRAKGALRAKGYIRQRLQERLGMLRRAERASAHNALGERFERRFIELARASLPPETFGDLVRAASRAAMNGGQADG